MNPIRHRPLGRSRPAPRRSGRTQKFGPSLFNQPADHRLRKRLAQSLSRRQCVDNVAHRAQAHDEQPFEVRNTFRLRNQDFLGESRERMIPLVEWSFGSPTISTRPPYSATTSRSGTVSAV